MAPERGGILPNPAPAPVRAAPAYEARIVVWLGMPAVPADEPKFVLSWFRFGDLDDLRALLPRLPPKLLLKLSVILVQFQVFCVCYI